MEIDPRIQDVVIKGDGYSGSHGYLLFVVSEAVEQDGRLWRHCSVSVKGGRMPSYYNLRTLKELTIGPDRMAVQVFPTSDRHIDIAGKMSPSIQVLHLWSPDPSAGDVLPDFTRGGNSI